MALRISSIASSASSTGILKAGSTVTFTVGLNQPAVVSGLPVLLLNDGGVAVYDPVLSKPGTVPAILYFHYTVRATDATSDLTVVDLSLAGGSVHSDGSLFLDAPKTLNVGSEPDAISAADLDGDKQTDLVVSNYGDGTVSVLLNQGIPALNNVGVGIIKFGPAEAFAAGSHLTDVAVGDLDGDTFPDLIVTDASSNQIVILKGDGRGSFTPLDTNPTETGPGLGHDRPDRQGSEPRRRRRERQQDRVGAVRQRGRRLL
jgi:FG-GAP-like repeat